MNEMSLQEQKQVALEVLIEIDKICRENGLTYSLAYGTLLGAVRHGGFIPWDDDIDIMMPRSDFLKFVDFCKKNHTKFELVSNFTDPEYGYIFAKACDKNTVVIPGNLKWRKYGVQVDIFPVENLGMDLQSAKCRMRATKIRRSLIVAWNWERFEKNPNRPWIQNVAKFVFYLLSRFVSQKPLICSVNRYYDRFVSEDSAYMGIVCGAYEQREIMPASIYDTYSDIRFEIQNFKTVSRYEEYLTAVYGNYMQLPPEEKRVTHHNFKAYRE